jgi:hypothetical protein
LRHVLERSGASVATAASAGEAGRDDALATGFSCQLGKPVDPDVLVTTIASLVNPQTANDA